MRRLEPSLSRLRIFPLPSSLPSSHPPSLLPLRSLSHLSSKTFLSRSHSRYLHPRMQNSAHHEHRAGKRMLERTESRRADRGSPKVPVLGTGKVCRRIGRSFRSTMNISATEPKSEPVLNLRKDSRETITLPGGNPFEQKRILFAISEFIF